MLPRQAFSPRWALLTPIALASVGCSGRVVVPPSNTQPPTCSDQKRNGDETGVDCGGSCAPCPAGSPCAEGPDCESSVCNQASGVCLAATCSDSWANGDETDVDCGGSACPPCPDGDACQAADDCDSNHCMDAQCQPPTCTDRVQNGDEPSIDCGGRCAPCPAASACRQDDDCIDATCLHGICYIRTCANGVRDGDETDADCGGACPPCAAGRACQDATDCASGFCPAPSHICAPPPCDDGVHNGDETSVDCGGPCPPCSSGQACVNSGDCASLVCAAGQCLPPTCDDGVHNATETDVDCGGACSPCANGLRCTSSGDCANGSCIHNFCVPATCGNGAPDPGETDIDCGGNCAPCHTGELCGEAADCQSGICTDGSCVSPSCTDTVQNSDEIAVDCGGQYCEGCPPGTECGSDADCDSASCINDLCAEPRCDDNTHNGSETDVDCGGDCLPCQAGLSCKDPQDCRSGACVSGQCSAPACTDAVRNNEETDVDCGGPNCPSCDNGGECTTDSDCQSGICDSSHCRLPTCLDGVLNGNETATDCGANCPPCDDGDGCLTAADCHSRVCGRRSICLSPTCSDAVRNGEETGPDCGGLDCAGCDDGLPCEHTSDCATGTCITQVCSAPTCSNSVQDAGESDQDCGGGSCPPCDDGSSCLAPADCISGVCHPLLRVCAAPTCSDSTRNGAETDVDCGGPTCEPCPALSACLAASDCASGVCFGSVCQLAFCGDGTVNGDEQCDDGNQNPRDDCPDGAVGPCLAARCGDGIVWSEGSGAEQCDDADTNDHNNCTNTCTTSRCGDGMLWNEGTGTERCDDGDTNDHNDCTNACQPAECGDGVAWNQGTGTEQCDDSNAIDTDDCRNSCQMPFCGDGSVSSDASGTLHEDCDDGDTNDHNGCTNACHTASCGDGVVWSDGAGTELCDDGDTNDQNDCTNACQPAACGDGIIWNQGVGIEECDDGNTIATDDCRDNCQLPFCGDGVTSHDATGDRQEDCDDGFNDGAYGTCMPDCTQAPRCGDGHHDLGFEACDDGVNDGSYNTCGAHCRLAPYCGDGRVTTPPEACDDAGTSSGDGCSADCTGVETGWFCPHPGDPCLPACGNGRFDFGEACDDDGECADGTPCQIGVSPCGDSSVCAPVGGDGCSPSCRLEAGYTCPRFGEPCRLLCGNGVLDSGEVCDDGGLCDDDTTRCSADGDCQVHNANWTCTPRSADGCRADCKLVEASWECLVVGAPCNAICGNGRIDPLEECDYGALNEDDQYGGCTTSCTRGSRCGDGVPDVGHEECDFGVNSNDGSYGGCRSDCTWSLHCGDGNVTPPETCEDGGLCDDDASACSADPTCQALPGADSTWQCTGRPADGCSAVCEVEPGHVCRVVGEPCDPLSLCGNGVLDGTEVCDDGGLCDDGTTRCRSDAYCQLADPSWHCTPRSDDGCDETCSRIDAGWVCPHPGRSCSALVCGDGVRAGLEQCDDDNTADGDGCSSACRLEPGQTCTAAGGNGRCELAECTSHPSDCAGCINDCGNGTCAASETCASCPSDCGACDPCHATVCGNGIREGDEGCDDFNTTAGDGCDASCALEADHHCFATYDVLCGNGDGQGDCPCTSQLRVCGNGIIEGGEECDDRKHCGDVEHSVCTTDAQCESLLASCASRCGNLVCELDECSTCPNDCPSQCAGDCGNGTCGSGETPANCPSDCGSKHCGDKNFTVCDEDSDCASIAQANYPCVSRAGDGCSPLCTIEPMFECFADGAGSFCRPICGDGKTLVAVGEECDDGNLISGDGCSTACTIEPGSSCVDLSSLPASITFDITYRDFRGRDETRTGAGDGYPSTGGDPPADPVTLCSSGTCRGHPDFEYNICNPLATGLVQDELDAEGKPVFKDRQGSQSCNSLSSAAWFSSWYRTVAGINQPFYGTVELELTDAPTRTYQFPPLPASSSNFFPLDGIGYGNREGRPGEYHNYHFTSTFTALFQYQGTGSETLTFDGDDDVWVFINGKLAVDIGGIHGNVTKSVTLSSAVDPTYRIRRDTKLGLFERGIYEIAFFHAERHEVDSNFRLTLSGFLRTDRAVCDGICGDLIVRGTEQCDDGALCDDDATPCSVSTAAADCGSDLPCTPRSNDGCSSTCAIETVCGNDAVEWPEECDPPDTTTCDPSCKLLLCGNNTVDGDEQCDGSWSGGKFCTDAGHAVCVDDGGCTGAARCAACTAPGSFNPCRFPLCGNHVVDAGEQCDNGSSNSDNGLCTTACTNAVCGDGFTQLVVGETCDDGSQNGTYGHCTLGCQGLGPHCGDGIVNGPEICDDGVNNGAYGTCRPGCLAVGNTCGDGVQDTDFEQCDAGAANNDGLPPERCNPNCTSNAHCGDGYVDSFLGEQCDRGAANDDLAYNGCKTTCQWGPRCGDGVANGSEVCDDGANAGAYGGCMPGCSAWAPYCGDGDVEPSHEECDDGDNLGVYNGCNPDCTWAAHCGDGWLDAGYEQCDLGASQNQGAYGTCNPDCTLPDHCGDGSVTGTESCDDGVNDGTYNTCNPDCTWPQRCGDALVQGAEGEECDDGVNDALYDGCRSSCRWAPYCGDGTIQSRTGPEQCEANLLGGRTCMDLDGDGITGEPGDFDGGTLGCVDAVCLLDTSGCFVCGDGLRNGFEQCDGGDLGGMTCTGLGLPEGTGLACRANCMFDSSGCGQSERCNDGVLDSGEVCDGALFGPNVSCADLNGNGVKDPEDFAGGTLGCTDSCTLDTSLCYWCGNGVSDPGELCDASDTGDATCVSVDPTSYVGGILTCNATCDGYDFSGCWACLTCLDCASQACIDHRCGSCVTTADCCSPFLCVGGSCRLF